MGWIAPIIAATAKKAEEHEEEMMPYTQEELDGNWEFKIVRSMTYAFGNPKTLRRLIEEEARAGWVMVEKFDDGRVRFKRPMSARKHDHLLLPEVNPYRTDYGVSQSALVWLLVGILLIGVVISVMLVLAL